MEEDVKRQLLLVETSKSLVSLIKARLNHVSVFPSLWRTPFPKLSDLARSGEQFSMAIVNLVLPNASELEEEDLILSHNLPPIIFAGTLRDELRQTLGKSRLSTMSSKKIPRVPTVCWVWSVVFPISEASRPWWWPTHVRFAPSCTSCC